MLFHRKKKEKDLDNKAIDQAMAPSPIKMENYLYNTEFHALIYNHKIAGYEPRAYDITEEQLREEREALLAQIRELLSTMDKKEWSYRRLMIARQDFWTRNWLAPMDRNEERMLLSPLTQRQLITAENVMRNLHIHEYHRAYMEFADCVDNYTFAGGTEKSIWTVVSANEYALYHILLRTMELSLNATLNGMDD